ncbi:major facilitator superfamily domain-containing protein, partial [Schizothecium vesticola]
SQNRNRTREIIDNGRLVKRLFWVGASGFFARSYTFFSGNVIKLALHYTYPHGGRLNSNPGLVLDQIGHVAALVSMIVVGHLADLYGRKRLYGYELLLLVVATLGIVQASEGYRSRLPDGTVRVTMNIYAWLGFWRFCLGLAIGAEQPLVAIITAEWVRTRSRGRMMAAVFSVQPIARLVAYGVALVALQKVSSANGLSHNSIGGDDEELGKRVADEVWRWVTGIGIIPALVAIGFRFSIPETPLYYAHILLDAVKGTKETVWLYGTGTIHNHGTRSPIQSTLESPQTIPLDESRHDSDGEELGFRRRDWYSGAVRCLRTTPAGLNLVLMSSLWMLSDVSWYLLAMDSLAPASTLRSGATTTSNQLELYRELEGSAKHFMLVVSIGSLLGSALLLAGINRVHRRVLLMATCGGLAVLFAVAGAVVLGRDQDAVVTGTAANTAIDVLSGMMHFLFTLGPRTLLPIMAVELFPTVYRGTFYSLACAAGRLGAIVVRPVISGTSAMDDAMGIHLLVAMAFMLLCVVISYFVPEVQRMSVGADDDTETGSDGEGGSIGGGDDGGGGVVEKGRGMRAATRRARGLVAKLLPKLDNMTLEEIAPNPHESQRPRA